jgi:hypothetical protein
MRAEHIAGHGQLGETQTAAVHRDDTKHRRRAVAEPPVELLADAGMQCLRVSVSTAIVRPRRAASVPLVTAKSMVRARPIGSTPCTVAVAPSRLANIVLCLTPVAASTPPMRPMAASCPA